MVLVDTSVWVNHLRAGLRRLETLLMDAQAASHPFVIGELACGNLKNRSEILTLLKALPQAPVISPGEFEFFIEGHRLMGLGIGFVDIHLLAAAKISGMPLWTADKRLDAAAARLSLAY